MDSGAQFPLEFTYQLMYLCSHAPVRLPGESAPIMCFYKLLVRCVIGSQAPYSAMGEDVNVGGSVTHNKCDGRTLVS